MSRSVPIGPTETVLVNSVAVRDTNTLTSTGTELRGARQVALYVDSTLDQAGSFQWQYSRDGVTWRNLGTATNVAATTTVALPGPGLYFGQVRVVFTAAVAPTTGTLFLAYHRAY